MEKVRDYLRRKSVKLMVMGTALTATMVPAALAAEGDSGSVSDQVIGAFQTGFQNVVSDAGKMIVVIVTASIGLAGLLFLVRKAFSWFKSIAK